MGAERQGDGRLRGLTESDGSELPNEKETLTAKQQKNGIVSLVGRHESQDKGRGILKYRMYAKEMFVAVNGPEARGDVLV